VAREACAAAVDAARHNGSRDLLASAALTLEPVGDPAWDGDIHAWCAEALAAAGQDASTQVRLLARLSQSAAYLRLDEEADRASADALQRAADLSDTEARVDALIARQLVRSGPDDVGELGELADQMLAVSASTGRADLERWGRLWRIDMHWYAGRLSAIASETAGLQRCAERAGGPYARWHLLSTRGMLALARAEFDDGQRIFGEAVELLTQIDHPAVHGASVAFGLLLGHHRGHSVELLDASAWDFGADVRWDLFRDWLGPSYSSTTVSWTRRPRCTTGAATQPTGPFLQEDGSLPSQSRPESPPASLPSTMSRNCANGSSGEWDVDESNADSLRVKMQQGRGLALGLNSLVRRAERAA
jgi:hypothetical protein